MQNDKNSAGKFPYTRGIHANMYREKLWTMRQYAGFGSAIETNRRFRYLLDQGQTGLSVAFDLPTQIGYDSDDPMSLGEVGKVGVAIDSIEDMENLLACIPLDKVSTSMTINASAAILLAMYIVVAENNGVKASQISGTIQNDILKEYIARGTYIYPPEHSMRLTTDIITYCSKFLPRWNSISISGYHIREAGSTAVQELAFTIANAIAYVEDILEKGLEIDDFAPRLSFFFNSHNDFLEEIAKFRAARTIWAKLMKHTYGANKEKSMQLRFHTQTGGSTLTAQQPDNNIIRVTLQALAAVLGGTQSLHTNAKDEALSLPTEESARVALRTQQVIAYESGVCKSVDPFGGSSFMEDKTDEIERAVNKYLDKIRNLGGAVAAINYMQAEIRNSAFTTQKRIESAENIIVGINKFESIEEKFQIKKNDDKLEDIQVARLKEFRKNRNKKEFIDSLKQIEKAAQDKNINLMPFIIDSVRAKATVGEICNCLRLVWGNQQ